MSYDMTSVISVSRCKYDNQLFVAAHYHDFFHIIYLTGGDGTLKIGNVYNKPIENDIYIIKPGTYHELTSVPQYPMRSIEVKFNTEDMILTEIYMRRSML
jgi:quercetin dioxygenase-like cupin family protein